MKPIYIELSDKDRTLLDALAADSSAEARRPVRLAEVVRQLVRDAAARGKPVRVRGS
jgi:hypothetical protein